MSVALYNCENAGLSAFEVGRQSNPGIDLISILSQLIATLGPAFAPPVLAITSVLLGTVGIAVANALFQAEQDRINAEAAAPLASSSSSTSVAAAAPAPASAGSCFQVDMKINGAISGIGEVASVENCQTFCGREGAAGFTFISPFTCNCYVMIPTLQVY